MINLAVNIINLDITGDHKEYLNTKIYENIKDFNFKEMPHHFKRYTIAVEKRRKTSALDLSVIKAETDQHTSPSRRLRREMTIEMYDILT